MYDPAPLCNGWNHIADTGEVDSVNIPPSFWPPYRDQQVRSPASQTLFQLEGPCDPVLAKTIVMQVCQCYDLGFAPCPAWSAQARPKGQQKLLMKLVGQKRVKPGSSLTVWASRPALNFFLPRQTQSFHTWTGNCELFWYLQLNKTLTYM